MRANSLAIAVAHFVWAAPRGIVRARLRVCNFKARISLSQVLLTARKDLRVLPAFRFKQDYSLCNRQRKPEHAAFPVAGGNTVSGAACRVA
jgi:hypothetical protein